MSVGRAVIVAQRAAKPQCFNMLYGPDIICAIIDSIEAYGVYMARNNVAASDTDSANIYYLTRLLRAIISDCCGINIH